MVGFCLSDKLNHSGRMGPVLPGASYRPGGYQGLSEGLRSEVVYVLYTLTHLLTRKHTPALYLWLNDGRAVSWPLHMNSSRWHLLLAVSLSPDSASGHSLLEPAEA